jgi:hypothetical protein
MLAGIVLLAGGCASYDDTAERTEFEKLRQRPVIPQDDRILPNFEGTSTLGDA